MYLGKLCDGGVEICPYHIDGISRCLIGYGGIVDLNMKGMVDYIYIMSDNKIKCPQWVWLIIDEIGWP